MSQALVGLSVLGVGFFSLCTCLRQKQTVALAKVLYTITKIIVLDKLCCRCQNKEIPKLKSDKKLKPRRMIISRDQDDSFTSQSQSVLNKQATTLPLPSSPLPSSPSSTSSCNIVPLTRDEDEM